MRVRAHGEPSVDDGLGGRNSGKREEGSGWTGPVATFAQKQHD